MIGLYVNRLIRRASSFLPVLIGSVLIIGFTTTTGILPSAIAAPSNGASIEIASAADQLDKAVGAGTSDRIQGKAQKDIGTVKRKVGQSTGQVEGAAEQVKGRAQQDVGRVESAVDEAGNALEDTADNAVDSIKGFFGQ